MILARPEPRGSIVVPVNTVGGERRQHEEEGEGGEEDFTHAERLERTKQELLNSASMLAQMEARLDAAAKVQQGLQLPSYAARHRAWSSQGGCTRMFEEPSAPHPEFEDSANVFVLACSSVPRVADAYPMAMLVDEIVDELLAKPPPTLRATSLGPSAMKRCLACLLGVPGSPRRVLASVLGHKTLLAVAFHSRAALAAFSQAAFRACRRCGLDQGSATEAVRQLESALRLALELPCQEGLPVDDLVSTTGSAQGTGDDLGGSSDLGSGSCSGAAALGGGVGEGIAHASLRLQCQDSVLLHSTRGRPSPPPLALPPPPVPLVPAAHWQEVGLAAPLVLMPRERRGETSMPRSGSAAVPADSSMASTIVVSSGASTAPAPAIVQFIPKELLAQERVQLDDEFEVPPPPQGHLGWLSTADAATMGSLGHGKDSRPQGSSSQAVVAAAAAAAAARAGSPARRRSFSPLRDHASRMPGLPLRPESPGRHRRHSAAAVVEEPKPHDQVEERQQLLQQQQMLQLQQLQQLHQLEQQQFQLQQHQQLRQKRRQTSPSRDKSPRKSVGDILTLVESSVLRDPCAADAVGVPRSRVQRSSSVSQLLRGGPSATAAGCASGAAVAGSALAMSRRSSWASASGVSVASSAVVVPRLSRRPLSAAASLHRRYSGAADR